MNLSKRPSRCSWVLSLARTRLGLIDDRLRLWTGGTRTHHPAFARLRRASAGKPASRIVSEGCPSERLRREGGQARKHAVTMEDVVSQAVELETEKVGYWPASARSLASCARKSRSSSSSPSRHSCGA